MQMDRVQLGFNFAKDLATQLITLSTGLLALSATFTKDIFNKRPSSSERFLKTAWVSLVVSIVFGVWTFSALTGTLMPVGPSNMPSLVSGFGGNVRVPAALQVATFLIGTVVLLL